MGFTNQKREATMWFEMQPDVYGGKTCDQVMPRWFCYADGDKDSDRQREPLVLDARHFPPGTKITVEMPVCPKCGEHRSIKYPTPKRGQMFDAKCECGFNWEAWVLEQYS